MRISDSVTSVSWIPSEAVTGAAFKQPFEIGLAHYDAPPPERIEDIEVFIAADRCRFANRLNAWIDVQDGVIVDQGLTGRGYIGATTLRLAGKAVTFTAVPLPTVHRCSGSPREPSDSSKPPGAEPACRRRAGSAIRRTCR